MHSQNILCLFAACLPPWLRSMNNQIEKPFVVSRVVCKTLKTWVSWMQLAWSDAQTKKLLKMAGACSGDDSTITYVTTREVLLDYIRFRWVWGDILTRCHISTSWQQLHSSQNHTYLIIIVNKHQEVCHVNQRFHGWEKYWIDHPS